MQRTLKLLIVDDEPDICEFTKMLFEGTGVTVYTALSAEEALEIIKRESPQLVLLDVLMKGLSGLEVLKYLKRANKKAYVIMVTALDDDQTFTEAKQYGANDYMIKPLILEDLERKVNEIKQLITTDAH